MKLQCQRFAIQISGKVLQPGLGGDVVACYGGTGSDIGYRGINAPIHLGQTGINAQFGNEKFLGQVYIGGGNPDTSAKLFSRNHLTGDSGGVASQAVGIFQISHFQKRADTGGGNSQAVHFLLGDNGADKALFFGKIR